MRIIGSKWLVISFFLLLTPFSNVSCQSFDFQLVTDTIMDGAPGGDDIVVDGNIINSGSIDLNIDIIRVENNMPAGWQSYICTDVCHSPASDSSRLFLAAGDTQIFKLSFITSITPDIGNCLIVLKNVTDAGNYFTERLYGSTATFGIDDPVKDVHLLLYPNPVADKLMISTDAIFSELKIYNMDGKNVLSVITDNSTNFSIDMSMLPAGTYFIKAFGLNGQITNRKVIKAR